MELNSELENLNPIVRLTRDDRVEIAVEEFISRHHTYCFLCCTSIQDSNPIRSYTANRIAICKSYLQDINHISFKNEWDNIEDKACPTCLVEVEKVWHLHEGIFSIKQQITSILTKALRQWHRPVAATAHSNLVKNHNVAQTSLPFIKIETESNSILDPKDNNGIYIVDNIFVGADDDSSSGEVDDSAVMPGTLCAEPKIVTSTRRKQTLSTRIADTNGLQVYLSPHVPRVTKSLLDKKLNCAYCDKTYFARTALVRHVRTVHEKVRYPCSVCGKELTTLRNRITHEVMLCKVVYTPEELKKYGTKIYKCEVEGCGKLFPRPDEFSLHIQKHADDQRVGADSGGGGDNFEEMKREVDEEREEMGEILNCATISYDIKVEDDATMDGEMINGDSSFEEYASMSGYRDSQVIESSYTESATAVDIVSSIFIGGPSTLGGNGVCNDNS